MDVVGGCGGWMWWVVLVGGWETVEKCIDLFYSFYLIKSSPTLKMAQSLKKPIDRYCARRVVEVAWYGRKQLFAGIERFEWD